MRKANNPKIKIQKRCWQEVKYSVPDFLSKIKSHIFTEAVKSGKEEISSKLADLRKENVDRPVIFIGTGTCGLGAGAGKTLNAVREYVEQKKLKADIVEVGCIGICSMEPLLDIQLPGKTRVCFGNVIADKAAGILNSMLLDGIIPEDMLIGQFRNKQQQAWDNIKYIDEHPFLVMQRRVVLTNCGVVDPTDIDQYIAYGGYSAMAHTVEKMTREEICNTVEISGLRGRGGGGFSTGKKWRFALNAESEQKYLICNADEGDPGAFMDRAVCESDPHRLLEGIVIAAYAIGATKAYIYIRAEYPLAIERLKKAISQAKAYGLIGDNILDSGNDLDIVIKMGAGAFVCGEETALIHSIEGKRGMPRPRPPFPAIKGLFDKPTIINNVETLANLSSIIEQGAEWFASMGTENSKGTKVFALSGMVRNTGLIEVPMGTTLRQIVFDIGGGIPNNKKCKAVQIGGPSGGCIPEAYLDIETDYEALIDFGAIIGSGGLVVADESTCMVDFAKYFMEFIQEESCGKCIPCREGTKRMLEILRAITRPKSKDSKYDSLLRFQGMMQLKKLAETIKTTSLCGLGQTAPNPVLSTLKWFRDEYEAHLYDRDCPAGSCSELIGVACRNSCPAGTEVWRYVAHIANGEYEDAYRVIRQANPFPSICARICNHPCEDACRLGVTGGEGIAIRKLKRFVVDSVDASAIPPDAVIPATDKSARIAVIGGGPAGLTAAHYLSVMGHKVTIFEREVQLGGMLTCTIPEYRLPREILKKEIASLLNDNIEVKLNTVFGSDITTESLFKDGYKAVYISTGAHKSNNLSLPDENSDGIFPSVQFLKAYNLMEKELAKGDVGIIGGGNSAVDAARVAIRQKNVKSVTIFYRRTQAEMPAYAEEIDAALEEGIKIKELVAPMVINPDKGKLASVGFIQNKLGEVDSSGRRRPVQIPKSEFDVKLDTLIVAISETPETESLKDLGVSNFNTLVINENSCATGNPAVFAGGDVVTGPNTVIDSIAMAKKAARMIDRYIAGKILKEISRPVLPSVYLPPPEITTESDDLKRVATPEIPVSSRKHSFSEVELCISEADAVCEAKRCLRCDLEFTHPQ